MPKPGLRLRQRQHRRQLSIHQQPAQQKNSGLGVGSDAEEFLVVSGFAGKVGELLACDEYPPYGGRQMIERAFDLGRAHPLVRWNKALRQQIALRIINEEYHVTVPVVLS